MISKSKTECIEYKNVRVDIGQYYKKDIRYNVGVAPIKDNIKENNLR